MPLLLFLRLVLSRPVSEQQAALEATLGLPSPSPDPSLVVQARDTEGKREEEEGTQEEGIVGERMATVREASDSDRQAWPLVVSLY